MMHTTIATVPVWFVSAMRSLSVPQVYGTAPMSAMRHMADALSGKITAVVVLQADRICDEMAGVSSVALCASLEAGAGHRSHVRSFAYFAGASYASDRLPI